MLTRGATSRLRSLATNLPYDVLRQIFLLEAADRCHWPCFWDVTGSPELLPFSLVCKSWTLPAQHVLFMSISLGVITDLEQFATVAKARPDLAAKVQAVRFELQAMEMSYWWKVSGGRAWDAGRSESRPIEDVRFEARSTAVVAVLRLCPNARKVLLRSLHPNLGKQLVDALMAAPLVELVHTPQSKPSAPELEDLRPVLQHNTLQRLYFRPYKHTHPIHSPSAAVPSTNLCLTELRLFGSLPSLDISLISLVGHGLISLHLDVENCVLDPIEARLALETTTSSLRKLVLTSNTDCITHPVHEEHPWIFDVLPQFIQLKELFIDQHASSWFLNVARAMPSTVTNFTFFTLCPELDPEPFFESVHTAIPDLKDLQSLSLHVYSDGQWEGFDYSDWEATLYGAFTDRGIDFTIHEDDFPELEWD